MFIRDRVFLPWRSDRDDRTTFPWGIHHAMKGPHLKYLIALALILCASPAYAWDPPTPTPKPTPTMTTPIVINNSNNNQNTNNNTANGGNASACSGIANCSPSQHQNQGQWQGQNQGQSQSASANNNNAVNTNISNMLNSISVPGLTSVSGYRLGDCSGGQVYGGLNTGNASGNPWISNSQTAVQLGVMIPLGQKPPSCKPDSWAIIAHCAALAAAGVTLDAAIFPEESRLCRGVHVAGK